MAHVQGFGPKVIAHDQQWACYEHPAITLGASFTTRCAGRSHMQSEPSSNNDRSSDRRRLIEKVNDRLHVDDIAEALREIGRYMDKYELEIPSSLLEEYTVAGRLKLNA